MNFKKLISGIAAAAIAASAFTAMAVTASAETKSIDIKNSSFETDMDTATDWKITNTDNWYYNTKDGAILAETSTADAHTGNKSAVFHTNGYVVINPSYKLSKNITYTLSAYVKGVDDSNSVELRLDDAGQLYPDAYCKKNQNWENLLTDEWTLVSVDYTPTADHSLAICIKGTAVYVDDVTLTYTTEGETDKPDYEEIKVEGGANCAYDENGIVQEFIGNHGAENAARSAAAAKNAGVTDTFIGGKINTFKITPDSGTIKKVTVTHSSGKMWEGNTEISAAGTEITYSIVATTTAESESDLKTALDSLSGNNFTVTVE